MADLASLKASVQKNTDVEKSAVLLLTGLSTQLKAAGTDPVALAQLQTALDSNTFELAAAVAANTPAAAPASNTGSGTAGSGTPAA